MNASRLRRRPLWSVVALIMLIALAGCGATPAQQPQASLEPIKVKLAWTHSIEYAGFYMAEEIGYFADAGLDVELLVADGSDQVAAVTSGEMDFGINSADLLLTERAAGAPVVAIATIYQRNPLTLISLAEKSIVVPQDLVGKTVVADMGTGTTELMIEALLSSQQIDPASVTVVPRTDFTNDALFNGQGDVIDVFVNDQPIDLEQQGHKLNSILVADYGIDMYVDVIYTSEQLINEHPEQVERFLSATLRGIQAAIENPEQAARLSVARNPELRLDHQIEAMRRALPLLRPAGTQPGMMRAEQWQTTYDLLRESRIITQPFDVEGAFTLDFLNRIYEQ